MLRTLLLFLLVVSTGAGAPLYVHANVEVAICPVCDNKKIPCPPCKTKTGFGICVPFGGPMACKSLGVTQSDGSQDMASGGGAEMMSKLAEQLMSALQKGGGGGGSSGGGGEQPQGNSTQPQSALYNDVLSSIYSAQAVGGSSSSPTIASDLISSLSKDFGQKAITSEVVSIVGQIAELAASTTITAAPTAPQPATTSSVTSAPAPAPEVSEKQDGVSISTVLGSTGIGAFFGQLTNAAQEATQVSQRFLGGICKERPWQRGIMATIFSSDFFDTLCVQRFGASTGSSGVAHAPQEANSRGARLLCPPKAAAGTPIALTWSCPGGARSGGVGFATGGAPEGTVAVTASSTATYTLQCANGGRAACVVEVDTPTATLEVSPAYVRLGGRARLYWSSQGATACEVVGVGMKERGLSGAVATAPIYDTTTFALLCTTPSGGLVEDKVIVEVGQ